MNFNVTRSFEIRAISELNIAVSVRPKVLSLSNYLSPTSIQTWTIYSGPKRIEILKKNWKWLRSSLESRVSFRRILFQFIWKYCQFPALFDCKVEAVNIKLTKLLHSCLLRIALCFSLLQSGVVWCKKSNKSIEKCLEICISSVYEVRVLHHNTLMSIYSALPSSDRIEIEVVNASWYQMSYKIFHWLFWRRKREKKDQIRCQMKKLTSFIWVMKLSIN